MSKYYCMLRKNCNWLGKISQCTGLLSIFALKMTVQIVFTSFFTLVGKTRGQEIIRVAVVIVVVT